MVPELVTPTGTLATRKYSRNVAYITTRKTTDIWFVEQISFLLSTTKLLSKKETLSFSILRMLISKPFETHVI